MHRLFVALRPPTLVRERLVDLQEGVPGARWQSDEQLHVTLRFVGEVDRHAAEDVAACLAQVRAPAARVMLAGVGRFERRGRTEALWAGLAPGDVLAALHRKVDHACVRAGLPPERRAYLPHVTLARLARGAGADLEVGRWLTAHGALAGEPFVLPHLILYQSYLGGEGARYEPVARWALE